MKNLRFILLFMILSIAVMANSHAGNEGFASALQQLTDNSFDQKSRAIELLIESDDERTLKLLQTMLGGDLYYVKQSKEIVFIEQQDDGYLANSVLTGEELGLFKKRKLKKISINNTLRTQLRGAIARLSLYNPDPEKRYNAVQQMYKDLDSDSVALLRDVLEGEQDSKVKDAIELGIAMAEVNSDQKSTRISAIETLSGRLHPEVRIRLNAIAENETDAEVKATAAKSLDAIHTNLKMSETAETLFFGLSLGSVLLLSAIGLAITFGVMGVINMAHGELMMLGAYTTYVVQLLMPNHIEYSLLVAVPAAFIVAGLVGIAIERGVIQFLYGRPLETLLATFGISLILQQLVRTIFSPLNRSVETPDWMSGALEINGALALTYNRLYILIFSLFVFFALLLILKKTYLGLHVRAVSQNRQMAQAMGVRSGWVDAMTFGLGSGIAGVAGVALSQLTNVGPNLGQAYIIDSFLVVVFGGVGNLWGTLVAAMSLGVFNKLMEPWAGAVLAKILLLVLIILFIQKKPRGLFPQKGRAAEN